MESDLAKATSSRSNSPLPALWFEFLLDPSYLEKHLTKENPDPSPCELIMQFLSNAVSQPRDLNSVPPMIAGIGENKVELVDPTLETKPVTVETKKMQALKLLAISVAAFLRWDLDIFEKQLPLPMQNTLLLDFLILAFGEDEMADISKQITLDFSSLSDQSLFALHLYHRWIIRALMFDSIPAKIPRTVNVPLPGQQTLSFVPPATIEVLVKMLHDSWQDSKFILEKLSILNRNVMIPTLKTFEIPSENKPSVEQNWELGILISSEELQCQVCYDLGCLHFFHEDYPKAGEMFFRVKELINKTITSSYCNINRPKYEGYLKACNVILKKNTDASCATLSFEEKLHYSIDNNYDQMFQLLVEDNCRQKISSAYREYLEQAIQSRSFTSPNFKTLYLQVSACNVIQEVLSGAAVTSKYLLSLAQNLNDELEILFDVILSTVEKVNFQQKTYLKNFISFLIDYEKDRVVPLVASASKLSSLFTEEEKLDWDIEEEMGSKSSFKFTARDFSGNNSVLETGELERELLNSYNPAQIKLIIKDLSNTNSRKPLWKMNTRWELPNPVGNFVLNLSAGITQDYIYIMIAKSRELAKVKSFDEAHQILEIVEREVADLSAKLSRAIRWEILLIDMLQIHANSTVLDIPSAELIRRCKTCITALHQDTEFLPRPEIIEYCAVYLLSVEQWDYLSTNDSSCSSRLEFASSLAKACIEIRSSNGSRKAAKELWEMVLPIFSSSNSQQKRMTSGLSVIQRDAPHAIFSRQSLNQFLEKIQNSTVLTIMISCLAKLHNILKDDTNNIFMEYPSPWPVAVSNASAFHIKAVYESLSGILNHSLKLFPHHIPFLKSLADLNYVLGYHTKCLKYYLEAAIISSDFFGQPIPRPLFDDQVYKRMIRCCSQLSCHTQAAVLCQFLEEVDYLTAFKSLQEKNCSDAMDAYYDCFWDLTILEFLVNLHSKRGEVDKKQLVLKIMGQLELNSNNNDEIKREAANLRKSNFMRALVEQFL